MGKKLNRAFENKLVLYFSSVLVAFLLFVGLFLLLQKFAPQAIASPFEPAAFLTPTATLIPPATSVPATPTPTDIPTLVPTATPSPCEWQPFSDVALVGQMNQPNCFEGLLELGIGADGSNLLFYKTLQRQRGLYGMVKLVGNLDDITVRVTTKKLLAGRFLIAVSSSQVPNDTSIGFRIQSEDDRNFYVKVISFLPGGYEKEISSSPSDPNWGRIYNVNFKIVGSKIKVIVNKATLVQWDIGFDQRYLFVGYQALPVASASTALDVGVEFP